MQNQIKVESDTFVGTATLKMHTHENGMWTISLEQDESCKEEGQDVTHLFVTDELQEEEAKNLFEKMSKMEVVQEEDFSNNGLWYI